MKDLGALIVILIIASQGVSAIVAAVKKRQKAAAGSSGAPTQLRASVEPATPKSADISPEEVMARRRGQLEELRARAKAQRGGTVTSAPAPPQRPSVPIPVQIVVDEEAVQPDARVQHVDTESAIPSAYTTKIRIRRSSVLRAALHHPERLREAIVLKELLDPPIALRNPADAHA